MRKIKYCAFIKIEEEKRIFSHMENFSQYIAKQKEGFHYINIHTCTHIVKRTKSMSQNVNHMVRL